MRTLDVVAVLRLEGMRGPERVVDGRRGEAFPGWCWVPASSTRTGTR